MSNTTVYLDNAATTGISESVLEKMLPWLKEGYGNASSVYALGRKSAIALNNARSECAALLGCQPSELIFTSGATESNNHALHIAAENAAKTGKDHIITSAFEHHSVLEPLKQLEKRGFRVTYLPVHEDGIIRPSELEAAVTDKTVLVSVMYVNNEIGTIQPIREIGEICRAHGIPLHTDAVQAFGNIPIDLHGGEITMLSLSGHKFHAPKGVGLLYIKRGTLFSPLIVGGGQQSGKRAGTENIAAIVGLAAAADEAVSNMDAKNTWLLPLRNKLIDGISKIPGVRLNGSAEKRIASNVNFSFDNIEGEALVLQLDLHGIAVSSGSACSAGSSDPSHALLALGLDKKQASGSIRVSMSDMTTEEEIDTFLEILPEAVQKLRVMR